MLALTPRFTLLAAFCGFAVVPQLCTVGAVVLPRYSHRMLSASKRGEGTAGVIGVFDSSGTREANLTTTVVDGTTYVQASQTDSDIFYLEPTAPDSKTASDGKTTVTIHKDFIDSQNNTVEGCMTCTSDSRMTFALCQANFDAQKFLYDRGVISPIAASDVSNSTTTSATPSSDTSSNSNVQNVTLVFFPVQSQIPKYQGATPPTPPNAPAATVTATVTVGATPSPPAGPGSLPRPPTESSTSSKSNALKVEVIGDDSPGSSPASSTALASDSMPTSTTTSPSGSAIDSNSPAATSTTGMTSRNVKLRRMRAQ